MRVQYQSPPILETLVDQIRRLEQRQEGWNGYDALPPDRGAAAHAITWLREFFREVESAGLPWLPPHVTASAEGEVVFQWSRDPKRLTLYFSAGEATFIQSWGADIETEMEDGDAASASERARLWEWLTS